MAAKNLLEINIGATIGIRSFEGGKNLAVKLRQYGLFIGDHARLIRLAPFGGPVLLEINGREIALSRSIAAKIIVEEI